jgi:hypothetical protein
MDLHLKRLQIPFLLRCLRLDPTLMSSGGSPSFAVLAALAQRLLVLLVQDLHLMKVIGTVVNL